MSNITCRLLLDSREDRLKFKELHNTLFKNTDMSLEWMNWYFDIIGGMHVGFNTRAWCMFDGDKLIGIWCVEPKNLITSESLIIKVGRCFSVGIHPDYRRQNLFVELSQFAIEQEHKFKQYEYIVGFPQHGRPVIDAHYKSGWSRVQDITMYSYIPDSQVDKKVLTYRANRIETFSCNNKRPGSFDECKYYRDLRWLEHPDNHYICLEHLCLSGYVVLKPYGDSCHILDLNGGGSMTTEGIIEILNVAKTLAYRHKWHELTLWHADNSNLGINPLEHGFKLGSTRGSSVTLIAVNINAKEPLSLSQCHFQMGSEEIY